ncbi:MAG TPA: hydroxyacylglutathione hydrolase [Thiolapillus brandeum]|uniref:Hydroxyacylglutathione hydrolase n=1 Tax=Thiolapillus brandeum TaxID=1076588 RepID=A0A831K8W8_9GAMM|nr:hydroxyacylglutathione hydrolase [Thiolapillus brandeum]
MLDVIGLPAFDDNYIWLLKSKGQTCCAVVDPGDEDPVIDYLQDNNLTLAAILITHKHGDHTGGVAALKQYWPQAVIYGPVHEAIAVVEHKLSEEDRVVLQDLQMDLQVMDVPGHTEGHIAYYGHGLLFCGDTLFAAGCGRVFSGSFEQLSDSLRRIAGLPSSTLIYCAHEYTLANLGFARWVEPGNPRLLQRIAEDQHKRAQGLPTVPSSLELELATNPFLRTGEPAVIAAAEKWAGRSLSGHREVFKALRQWKDRDYD